MIPRSEVEMNTMPAINYLRFVHHELTGHKCVLDSRLAEAIDGILKCWPQGLTPSQKRAKQEMLAESQRRIDERGW